MGDEGKVWGAVAIAIGAGILGGLLLKAIFSPKSATGYRCPECNLVIMKNTNPCPRCGTRLDWSEVD